MKMRRILVTGCSRSGTKSMANILKDAGIRVEHERMGTDGTVSCFFYDKSRNVLPFPKTYPRDPHEGESAPHYYKFRRKIHLVREPLACISSNVSVMNRAHQEWLVARGIITSMEVKPKLLRMMQMWHGINNFLDLMKYELVKIEDDRAIKSLIASLGGDVKSFTHRRMNKASGYNKPKELEWSDLEKVDQDLTKRIRKLAKAYGYRT